ncbi:MAG: tRNA A-37 threonylcarbamoyl transferase component Bud32, partial [Neolewinella sp.]
EDATMASGSVNGPSGSVHGDGSEDATMASGTADGASEDPTIASGSASKGNQAAQASKGSPGPAPSGQAYNSGELMGQTIGGCRVDKLLGRGAMGAVYKARQLKLDRDVAVKVIRPEMMTDPRMLKRFEIEARTVGKFNSANVVMVHDVGFELGVHYIVMEFVEGTDLRQHVKLLAGGRLSAGDALPLIRQACKGLEEARRLKVVHRDIKPDNLMLTTQNVLKIADFGIAKPEEDFSMTMTSELIGTPLYMSPEQCQGGADLDFRSDMYSLGATFFYLLTGEPPIRASSVYELIQTKTKLENLCLWKSLPELDENHPLSRVIERMTANDREDRYESYEELLNDLLLVEAGETITVRAKRIKKDTAAKEARFAAPEKSGSSMMVILMLLLVLGGGGGGYYWWATQQKAGGGLSIEAATKVLTNFRERLAAVGPSKALRDELKVMDLPQGMGPVRDGLQSDIRAGLEIDTKLQLLKAPTTPSFEAVTSHFAAVAAAGAGSDEVGKEVRDWLLSRINTVRAGRAVGDAAVLELGKELEQWRGDLRDANKQGRDGSLPELAGRLAEIDAARLKLIDALPDHRAELGKDGIGGDVQTARAQLVPETVGDDGAKVRAEQAAIRLDFMANGPKESLLTTAKKLNSTDAAVKVVVDKLVDDMDRASKARQAVTNVSRPVRATAPSFDRVDAFLKGIENSLKGAYIDGKLPAWAQKLRDDERQEKKWHDAMVAECVKLWQAWEKDRDDQSVDLSTLKEGMARIEVAFRRAAEVLPACADDLQQQVPRATRESAMGPAMAKRKVSEWQRELVAARDELRDVSSLASWRSRKRGVIAAHGSLGEQLINLEDNSQLKDDLKRFFDDYTKWANAAAAMDKAAQQFGRGELQDCSQAAGLGMVAEEGKDEFAALVEVVVACQNAFTALEQTLDFREVEGLLAKASVLASAKGLPVDVGRQISAWQGGVKKLQQASSGMILIPGAGGQKACFVSGTECRNSEFKAFQAVVKNAQGMGGLDAVKRLLKGMAITKADFGDLLDVRTVDGDKPVERVTWTGALAYCRWRGLDLPTKEEWKLAAFGIPPKKFSWGPTWTDADPSKRNPNSDSVNVDVGGGSWRNVDLHHMSGNVAEWLGGDSGGLVEAIGGRYAVQRRARAQEQASGQVVETLSKTEGVKAIGFRAVLRPRDYPEITWPR